MFKLAMALLMTTATLPSPKIVEVTTPKLRHIVEPPFTSANRLSEVDKDNSILLQQNFIFTKKELVKKYGSFAEQELASLERFNFSLLTNEGQSALQKTIEIYQELLKGTYDQESARTYLHFCTQLFANHLSGGALQAATALEQFKEELLQPDAIEYSERPEEERGHNPSWIIRKKGTKPSYAILKESIEIKLPPEIPLHHPLCFSSFLQHLPNMPLTTTVTDYELIGYELDALFGFDRTPMTLKARFSNSAGAHVIGIIQHFQQHAEPIGNFIYQKDRACELATLPPSKVHLSCLSGMFKGVGAHHIGNYLLISSSGSLVDVLEIDLEEIMPPYNQVPLDVIPTCVASLHAQKNKESTQEQITESNQKIQAAQKAIVLCRLVLIGLPQAKQPLERALLMTICHPSFQVLLKGYHGHLSKNALVHPSSLAAQQERLENLQQLSREALKAIMPTLTVRDLYFALFGGREQYAIAKKNGYPDITAFNNVVSDPYQDVIKDFSCPSAIKPSQALDPIKASDSEEDKIRKANLQALELFYKQ